MSEALKKYAIQLGIIAIALGFIIHSIKSCGPVIPGINHPEPSKTPVVDMLGDTSIPHSDRPGISAPRTPTASERKTPTIDGGIPVSVTDIKAPTCRPWDKLKQKIIVSDKGNTFVSQVCSTYAGWNFKTKFLMGYNGYLNLGLMQNVLSYDRYDLGAIVAFPSVGVGLSGYVTDHFYLVGGATWNYVIYDNFSDPKTYSIGDFKPRPIIGFGFDF
jgi:hypothetical protein